MVSLWMNMQQTLVPELHALRASIPEARFTRTTQRISRRCSHSGPARSLGARRLTGEPLPRHSAMGRLLNGLRNPATKVLGALTGAV